MTDAALELDALEAAERNYISVLKAGDPKTVNATAINYGTLLRNAAPALIKAARDSQERQNQLLCARSQIAVLEIAAAENARLRDALEAAATRDAERQRLVAEMIGQTDLSAPIQEITWEEFHHRAGKQTREEMEVEITRLREALEAADRDMTEALRTMNSRLIMSALAKVRAALNPPSPES